MSADAHPPAPVGILLAAGRGVRFGGGKLLARLPDGTPVGVAAARALRATLPRVIAVVRPGDCELAATLAQCGVEVVECGRADEGMGATLACGVAAAGSASGYVVALADMPWIGAGTIEGIAKALEAGASIAAPFYRGRRGHPVGFSSRHREPLLALTGDEGARSLIEAHRAALVAVDVDDAGILLDVDRPEDLG